MKNITLISFALTIVMLSGCSQKLPELETSAPILDSGYSESSTAVTNDDQLNQMESMNSDTSYGSQDELINAVQNEVQTIYFSTDSYRLSDSEMSKIAQNSSIFNGDLASDLSIKIEGNCDEWGTDEYNYALGLKRAKSAKDSLVRSGVSEDRMSLISYGESTPNCYEHNTGCWQQNRRVDFKLFP
ncbi:MAG TPA: peptidoglycan-associated lipoprotein [Campylobacterales bacterium]|nr:peptidoglycan-associated lipoprotein [Campylobacterales bacterium]